MMTKKQIEVLEKIGERNGEEVCKAVLRDGENRHKGYVISYSDGRGVWLETNPLDWEVLDEGNFAGNPIGK